MQKKLYSIKFRGEEFPTLIELDDAQVDNLLTGGFVVGNRYNTKTHERSRFGFSKELMLVFTESDYQIEETA